MRCALPIFFSKQGNLSGFFQNRHGDDRLIRCTTDSQGVTEVSAVWCAPDDHEAACIGAHDAGKLRDCFLEALACIDDRCARTDDLRHIVQSRKERRAALQPLLTGRCL